MVSLTDLKEFLKQEIQTVNTELKDIQQNFRDLDTRLRSMEALVNYRRRFKW